MSKFKRDIYYTILLKIFSELDGNNVDESGFVT